MKKLLVLITIALIFYSNTSCETKIDPYKITVEATNGMGKKDNIVFRVEKWLVDSLKVDRDILIRVANDAARRAPGTAKNKLTYEFAEKDLVEAHSIYTNGVSITVGVKGIASNSYGVKGEIMSTVEYDLKGNILKDENGLPIIISWEN